MIVSVPLAVGTQSVIALSRSCSDDCRRWRATKSSLAYSVLIIKGRLVRNPIKAHIRDTQICLIWFRGVRDPPSSFEFPIRTCSGPSDAIYRSIRNRNGPRRPRMYRQRGGFAASCWMTAAHSTSPRRERHARFRNHCTLLECFRVSRIQSAATCRRLPRRP
jgi:hypothetical protein